MKHIKVLALVLCIATAIEQPLAAMDYVNNYIKRARSASSSLYSAMLANKALTGAALSGVGLMTFLAYRSKLINRLIQENKVVAGAAIAAALFASPFLHTKPQIVPETVASQEEEELEQSEQESPMSPSLSEFPSVEKAAKQVNPASSYRNRLDEQDAKAKYVVVSSSSKEQSKGKEEDTDTGANLAPSYNMANFEAQKNQLFQELINTLNDPKASKNDEVLSTIKKHLELFLRIHSFYREAKAVNYHALLDDYLLQMSIIYMLAKISRNRQIIPLDTAYYMIHFAKTYINKDLENFIQSPEKTFTSMFQNVVRYTEENILRLIENLESSNLSAEAYRDIVKRLRQGIKNIKSLEEILENKIPSTNKFHKQSTSQQIQEYYQTLELKPGATSGEIRKKYLQLALKNHPDKTSGQNSEPFKKIKHAYEELDKIVPRETPKINENPSGSSVQTPYNPPFFKALSAHELKEGQTLIDTIRQNIELYQSQKVTLEDLEDLLYKATDFIDKLTISKYINQDIIKEVPQEYYSLISRLENIINPIEMEKITQIKSNVNDNLTIINILKEATNEEFVLEDNLINALLMQISIPDIGPLLKQFQKFDSQEKNIANYENIEKCYEEIEEKVIRTNYYRSQRPDPFYQELKNYINRHMMAWRSSVSAPQQSNKLLL